MVSSSAIYVATYVSNESILIKADLNTGAPIAMYNLKKYMSNIHLITAGNEIIVRYYDTPTNKIRA